MIKKNLKKYKKKFGDQKKISSKIGQQKKFSRKKIERDGKNSEEIGKKLTRKNLCKNQLKKITSKKLR